MVCMALNRSERRGRDVPQQELMSFLYQLSAEQHALEAVCGRSVSAALITPVPPVTAHFATSLLQGCGGQRSSGEENTKSLLKPTPISVNKDTESIKKKTSHPINTNGTNKT